jgi:hypothetical protein
MPGVRLALGGQHRALDAVDRADLLPARRHLQVEKEPLVELDGHAGNHHHAAVLVVLGDRVAVSTRVVLEGLVAIEHQEMIGEGGIELDHESRTIALATHGDSFVDSACIR